MLYCMYYGCVSIQGKLGEIRIVEIFENETSEWTDGERTDGRTGRTRKMESRLEYRRESTWKEPRDRQDGRQGALLQQANQGLAIG
jgi:hypothetical protein